MIACNEIKHLAFESFNAVVGSLHYLIHRHIKQRKVGCIVFALYYVGDCILVMFLQFKRREKYWRRRAYKNK